MPRLPSTAPMGSGTLPASVVTDTSISPTSPVVQAKSPRNRALRDFVSILDYGTYTSGDMTATCVAAATDALNKNKMLYGPAHTYLLSAPLVDDVGSNGFIANKFLLRGDGPESTEFLISASYSPNSHNFVNRVGSTQSTSACAVTAQPAQNQLTLSGTGVASLVLGQYVLIQDTTQTIVGGTPRAAVSCLGEWARIYSINGTTFTFHHNLEFNYTTSATVQGLLNNANMDVRGVSVGYQSPGGTVTTAAFSTNTSTDNFFESLHFHDLDGAGIVGFNMVDSLIHDVSFQNIRDLDTPSGTKYDLQFSNASQRIMITHVRSRYGRHIMTVGGAVNTACPQYIWLKDAVAIEHSAGPFDNHAGCRKIRYEDCWAIADKPNITPSFGQSRSPDCEWINCRADNIAGDGLFIVNAADRNRVINFTANNVGTVAGHGIRLSNSDSCYIGGETLINTVGGDGIRIEANTNSDPASKVYYGGSIRIVSPSVYGVNDLQGFTWIPLS